ncbi:MAG: glycosyltransferase family 9 protein [Chitinophagales bacterium]|nr:glycosyltransferase family 9 protein [Chitinophagales bacterium]MDW8418651.1 glycosyltransferase family 9 protein [Chitinophagales bacterium]
MKFLVLRFSSIGDIVLTTPILRCLHHRYPGAEIHYATKSVYADLLKHNPHIHHLHLLQGNLLSLITTLRRQRFDYIIDLHNNQRTQLIKWLLFAPATSFPKLNFKKWLWVNFKINRLPPLHVVDRYFEAVRKLDVRNDNLGLEYYLSEKDVIGEEFLPSDFQKGFAVWVVGAKQKTKQFPPQKIAETLRMIQGKDIPVVLLGGREDTATAMEIKYHAPDYPLLDLCGKLTLNQSASAIRQSNLVVTNDTGMMHIAAAFKKNTIVLWGNTTPSFGMYPYMTEHINIEVHGLSCRPCSKLGYARCPKKHFLCMQSHDPQFIAQEIFRRFHSPANRENSSTLRSTGNMYH